MTTQMTQPTANCMIEKVWLSRDPYNPTICVNFTQTGIDWLESKGLEVQEGGSGAGTEGMLNSQLPVDCGDSQQYLADDQLEDALAKYSEEDRDAIHELLTETLGRAASLINWQTEEWLELFGTDAIKPHSNGLQHGYYNGSNLALLENTETGEAYVTLALGPQNSGYYADEFKTFESLDEAKAYIRSNIHDNETLQDFNITHRIWADITGTAEQ